MLESFRKAFFPSEEELERSCRFVESIRAKREAFLLEQGLSIEEISLLEELEGHETTRLRTFESYTSREHLLVGGITTVEQVKRDIQAWRDRG